MIGVHRHDAALEQAEQRRDDVERGEPVERQDRAAAPRPAATEPSSSVASAADAVGDEARARRLTMPKPSISESISAPRAGAVAEVAAVGDDVHLRHRHRDAAGDAGDAQQRLQRVGRQAERPRARAAACSVRRAPTRAIGGRRRSSQRQRQHGQRRRTTPMPIWVVRQPSLSMKCCTIGGQIAPAR